MAEHTTAFTVESLEIDGLRVSGVEFIPDDGFPWCVGYMVGADDGHSTLHPTPAKAIAAYRQAIDAARSAALSSPPSAPSEPGR